jgi:CDP-diglyceride synthetase
MRLWLLIATLGGILLLISSRADIRDQKQRTTTLTGLLLLFWVGLTLFGFSYFSISRSAYVIGTFYFAQQLVAGVCAAMLIFLFWPDGAKPC